MTRRSLVVTAAGAAAVVLVVLVVALASRDGDPAAAPALTTAEAPTSAGPVSTATLAPGTLPPTAGSSPTSPTSPATAAAPTTPAPSSSTTVTTELATTATAPTTAAATTTTDADAAPAFPCRADLLLRAYIASQTAPPDTRIVEPRCYGIWASGLLTAPGRDRALAVFGPGADGWLLLNAGTAFVCQPLEVPDPAYTTIGCPDWDR